MLAFPAADVLAQRAIEFLSAQHRLAQDRQHQRRLLIRRPIELAHLVGLRDHRLLAARNRGRGVGGQELAAHGVGVGGPLEKRFGRIVVGEGVEALVHPRIASLVRSDLHGEPLMPQLVHEHPVLVLTLLERGTVNHHRVLHPLDQALDRGDLRPRISAERAREMSECGAHHGVRLFPRCGFWMIERLDQDAVPGAGIPAQPRAGRPRKVTHTARGEPPRLGAGHASCRIRSRFLARDNLHGLSRGGERTREPGSLLR